MKVFGKGIGQNCEYCKNGTLLCDGEGVVCNKYGFVKRKYDCRKFVYDPLKRTPKSVELSTDFDASDFSIE